MSEGERGQQGAPGIQGQHGGPGEQGIVGQQGVQGVQGAQGDPGLKGGRGKSGFDWTPLVAYLLLASAFIFTARENRIQTSDILKQRAMFESCVNNLRKDLRLVIRDFQQTEDETVYVRAQARLENREC